MPTSISRTAVRSVFPYQLLLYCNAWYFGLYFIAEVLLLIFKGETLPYPRRNLASEIVLLIALLIVECIRNFFGQKGNLTEQMSSVVVSLVLTVPCLLTVIYFLLWQTYVLRLDIILSSIQIVFLVLETLFAVVAVASFARASPLRGWMFLVLFNMHFFFLFKFLHVYARKNLRVWAGNGTYEGSMKRMLNETMYRHSFIC